MGFIAKLLGSTLGQIIVSAFRVFFPEKTAADVKVDVLQSEVDTLDAEAKAAANAPTSMEALIAKAKGHDL